MSGQTLTVSSEQDFLSIDDLHQVYRQLYDARYKWYNIGLELRVSPAKLNDIRKQYFDFPEDCFRELLSAWLSSRAPRPTWAKLVSALESPTVGSLQLAVDLLKNFLLPSVEKQQSVTITPEVCNVSKSSSHEIKDEAPEEKLLGITDLNNVCKEIKSLSKAEQIILGWELGLSPPKLTKSLLPETMVAAWLHREDSVLQKSGLPTWSSLACALKILGHAEIADKIIQERVEKESKQVEGSLGWRDFPDKEKPQVIVKAGTKEKGAWDLCGVEVCGEITVLMRTSVAQHITWKGFGLKLHIDDGSLPAGIDQCTLTIKASLAGHYEFPDKSYLVSAVFWLRCEPMCKFTKPVIVEMQHCARSENVDNLKQLKFVRAICSQKQLPYMFKEIPGGVFSSHSSYGVIEVNCFSGWAIINKLLTWNRSYLANLLYKEHPTNYTKLDIYIAVTWDLDSHYTDALVETNQPIQFESDQIEFKISNISDGEWGFDVANSSILTKERVDKFTPGTTSWIPHSHFIATFKDNLSMLCDLKCAVDVVGAREPNNKFKICITPKGLRRRSDTSQTVTSDARTIKTGTITDLDQLFNNIAIDLCEKYMEVGIELGLQESVLRNELETGESRLLQGSKKALKMLQLWKQSTLPENLTYSALATALEKYGLQRCSHIYLYHH